MADHLHQVGATAKLHLETIIMKMPPVFLLLPTLMAEGAYEAGEEYGFAVTPLWVRRQAYYSYLAGGHHSYGHNDSWRIRPSWKQALAAPGARQMGVLRKIFEARAEWWLLEPDQSLFATGGKTQGRVLRLAARHRDGQWAMFYLGDQAESTTLRLRRRKTPGERPSSPVHPWPNRSRPKS